MARDWLSAFDHADDPAVSGEYLEGYDLREAEPLTAHLTPASNLVLPYATWKALGCPKRIVIGLHRRKPILRLRPPTPLDEVAPVAYRPRALRQEANHPTWRVNIARLRELLVRPPYEAWWPKDEVWVFDLKRHGNMLILGPLPNRKGVGRDEEYTVIPLSPRNGQLRTQRYRMPVVPIID